MKRESVRLVVTGLVQGVGYRAFVQRHADALGLSGWVRNRHDGTVELAATGSDTLLEKLIEALRRGPPGARVDSVQLIDAGPSGEPRFRILPTA